MKNRSIVFTWAVSYIMIMVIPIITAIITYYIAENLCVKLTDNYNREILQSKKIEIDRILEEASSFATELSFNYNVEEFSIIEEIDNSDEFFQLYKLNAEWRSYYSARENIHNAYVYFPKSQYISGVFSSAKQDVFFKSQYNGKDYEQWFEMLNTISKGNIKKIQGIDESIFFVQSIYSVDNNDLKANVVMEIKLNNLINTQTLSDSPHALIIYNDNYDVFLDNRNDKQDFPINREELAKTAASNEVTINNVSYIISVLASSKLDWKYMYLTDKKLYSLEITDIRIMVFIGSFLCLIISSLLIYYWIRRNHLPLRKILDSIGKYTNLISGSYDEYKYIDKTIIETFKQKSKIENELSKRQQIIREYSISRLLNNKDLEYTDQLVEDMNVKFNGNYFAVVLFSIESTEGMFYEDSNKLEDYELAPIIITNILSEMIGKQFQCIAFEENALLGFIVNFQQEQGAYEIMLQILKEADSFIYSTFKLHYTTAISIIHENAKSIRKCYNEAVVTMEYKFVQLENNIIEYVLIDDESQFNYYYPIELEQSLVNNLKIGATVKCKEIVFHIYEKNFTKDNLLAAAGQCLIYDILSTIVKTVDNISVTYNLEEMRNKKVFEIVEKCGSISAKKEAIIKIIEDFCAYLNENITFISNDFVMEINDYVNKNYADKNLNVASIADKFNLNPDYLSSVYKKKMGFSLLEYISRVRIDAAKEKINSNQMTIKNIADAVGYTNSRTFIRVFVKLEGVTPGQYKK